MHSSLFGRLLSVTVIVAAALASLPAHAGPFTNLFVFGDSLSDTGNLKILSPSDYPPPSSGPYYDGRFSDGPVWVETLAADLGLAASTSPYFAGTGGTNFAIAGARTGSTGSPPGVLAQVGGIWFPAFGAADPNALYVVVGGGNDLRDARSTFQTRSRADAAGREAAAEAAIGNLISSIGFLAAHGAKHVLVSNLPDLGTTPEARLIGLRYASTDVSRRFDALMPELLSAGVGFGLDMSFLDMAGLLGLITDDAKNHGGATYGITNVRSPCAGFLYSTGHACSSSLFSDALHPSAVTHHWIGEAAYAAVMQGRVTAPVPEPETYALMAAGLALVAVRARRRTRRIGLAA
jgi:phospholipase/lecithinase/hemolysin